MPRPFLVALAFVAGCGLLGDTPPTAEASLAAIRQACELAGAPEGDLDVCADLVRAEADRVAAGAR